MARLMVVAALAGLVALCSGCSSEPKRQGPNANYIGLKSFLKNETDYYQWDAVVGHVHVPNAERRRRWTEHAAGSFVLHTNNLGFREDVDTALRKAPGTVRILVTGDSHTDGVVPNSESFSNVLEGMLTARFKVPFEVLNGGVGHYGPYNFPRFLEKYGPMLEPDLYVVNFYVGNDFLDACRILENRGEVKNRRPSSYMKTLQKAAKDTGVGISQGLNQAFYFHHFPEMAEKALDFSFSELMDMKARADRLGIPVLVTILPTKVQVDWKEKKRAHVREIMGLTREELEQNDRLAAKLCDRLEAAGVDCLSLEPYLLRYQTKLYWNYDHHLSTVGHRAVAEILVQTQGERFEALAANALAEASADVSAEASADVPGADSGPGADSSPDAVP